MALNYEFQRRYRGLWEREKITLDAAQHLDTYKKNVLFKFVLIIPVGMEQQIIWARTRVDNGNWH